MKNCEIYIELDSKNINNDFIRILKKFIPLTSKFLGITKPFKLFLVHSKIPELRTTGLYKNTNNTIWVKTKNRNMMADIFRSICHEMVHHRQNELNMLHDHSGDDGSPEEGQANRISGIIIRKLGKLFPEIYD